MRELTTKLLNGALFCFTPNKYTNALCSPIREALGRTFPEDNNPQLVQHRISSEEFFSRVRALRVWLASGPLNEPIRELLRSFGCDLSLTYFDALRLRAVTSDGHKNPAAAPAYYPHRDVWFANPPCQINWWMPLFDVTQQQSLGFYPGYWTKPIQNDSAGFDYNEFIRSGGWQAYGGGLVAKQHHPTVQEKIQEEPLQIACQQDSLILFAGAHLHAPIGHQTGTTRFSVEFRTFHIADWQQKRGNNIDNQSKGSTAKDFIRASDFEHLQEGEDIATH